MPTREKSSGKNKIATDSQPRRVFLIQFWSQVPVFVIAYVLYILNLARSLYWGALTCYIREAK